jgi:hypothetical protein
MDEVHYIQDPDRGHVWEETLILAASVSPAIQLVLLSATMPSAASLGKWLADLHQRRVVLLSTTFRVVPLVHGILSPSTSPSGFEVLPLLDAKGGWIGDAYSGWLRAKTGSLTKTNSLAGIVTDFNGRVLTFAFISNNAGFEGRTAIDALASKLRTCGCT